jgi:predicted PurR-regulated permease PerM
MEEHNSQDITRTTLSVLLIGILISTVFWILHPFLPSLIWATMIVIATWPLMLRVQGRLWGKRGLAALAMTMALILVFVIPFWLAVATIIDNYGRIGGLAESFQKSALPLPPLWVGKLPMIGPKLSEAWQDISSAGPQGLILWLKPYAGKLAQWFVNQAGSVGKIFGQFLLTVVIAAILYAKGDSAADGIRRFARRLIGHHGEEATILAAKATRGVALGVVVTALVQSLLGGIGLALTGVPAAGIFTAVMFMLCVGQLGPGFVLIPAIVWLYWSGHAVAGTVLLVWTVVVVSLDNVLRPVLIKKGADLPLLLIFAGVMGGLIAFGIVGIFVGPVVLAVALTLLRAWIDEEDADVQKKEA